MGSNEIGDLAARVELLERDVGIMKGILWRSGPTVPAQGTPTPPPPPRRAPATQWAPPPWVAQPAHAAQPSRASGWAGPGAPAGPAAELEPPDEATLAGTWFARAGALAVLIGAGFAFKYGIDRGFITEGVRVLIGLLVGLAFVAWGYWARRQEWHTFSQAVTAGGIAICYLSVTVADLAYHLVSGPVTFAALLVITAGSAALAYWYDSLALAVLATLGGFLNPFLAWPGGKPQALPLYSYLTVLDAGVLGLAFVKAWRPLDAFARAGTWLLFGIGLRTVGFGAGEAFATAFLLLFIAVPILASLAPARRARPSDEADGVLLALSAVAYFGYSMFLLWHNNHADLWGLFTFGLAGAFAGLAWLATLVAPADRVLRRFLWGLAVAATTVAIPQQFRGFAVALGWAGVGLAVTLVGMRARSVSVRTAGAVILGGVASWPWASSSTTTRPRGS